MKIERKEDRKERREGGRKRLMCFISVRPESKCADNIVDEYSNCLNQAPRV